MITNETLPKNPAAESTEIEGKPVAVPSNDSSGEHPSAEQWKSRILAQKNVIVNLQTRIDKVNNSIRFVVADEYYNGLRHNERQVKKQENVAQMQEQLEEQKKNLAAMQEAARHAGMGSAVYDP